MSWIAFDRAIRIAKSEGKPTPLQRWRSQRDRIYGQVWEQGWDHRTGAFVQRYDSQVLDASLMRMAQVGFLAPRDLVWLDALGAMESLVNAGWCGATTPRRHPTDCAAPRARSRCAPSTT
ncbi:hypothetical protein G7043_25030 [Lentzea sp. NEAU-D13]|uniref:GH15-like domain-containing protein n=1 Tax=Lentzea alba TaxID=2714351 RepID=A0A7C9W0A0_9PSEU|nr:glycoside hydrolase family 15 protein [Lentzea alba]NGY62197.1 hypothetical protein [Lentzea alba]